MLVIPDQWFAAFGQLGVDPALGNSAVRRDDNPNFPELVDVFLGGAFPLGNSLLPILPRINVRIL